MIREVLTSDLLQHHLSRYYLHPSLIAESSEDHHYHNYHTHLKSLLIQLGVHELTLPDIIDILKSALLSTSTHHDITTTAKWLVVLYHCFNSGNHYSMQQEEQFLSNSNLPRFKNQNIFLCFLFSKINLNNLNSFR